MGVALSNRREAHVPVCRASRPAHPSLRRTVAAPSGDHARRARIQLAILHKRTQQYFGGGGARRFCVHTAARVWLSFLYLPLCFFLSLCYRRWRSRHTHESFCRVSASAHPLISKERRRLCHVLPTATLPARVAAAFCPGGRADPVCGSRPERARPTYILRRRISRHRPSRIRRGSRHSHAVLSCHVDDVAPRSASCRPSPCRGPARGS